MDACSGTRGHNRFPVCPVHNVHVFPSSPPPASVSGPPTDSRGPLGTCSCFLAAGTLRLSASVSVCSARGRDNDHDEPTRRSKPGPFTSLVNGPGILERQREEFMAWTAALNSSAMKARGSITHLFVFLRHWITGSVADSSLEWNENKTIIQRTRACRKGRRCRGAFQEFRPISLVGHVHLRQERCPRGPRFPFAFYFREKPWPWWGPSGRPGLRGSEGGEGSGASLSSPLLLWEHRARWQRAAPFSDLICSQEQSSVCHQAGWVQGSAGEGTWDTCTRRDFQAWWLEALRLCSSWFLWCCCGKGRAGHPCIYGRTSLRRNRATAAFWGPFGLSWDVSL